MSQQHNEENVEPTNNSTEDFQEEPAKDEEIQVESSLETAETTELSEVEQLKQEAADNLLGWQRAQADYKNLQKEVAKERESFSKFAKVSYLMQLLPLYTNFQMAFSHLPEDIATHEWVKGMEHIRSQFDGLLKELNVQVIPTHKQTFDAQLHEAVAQEQSDEHETGMIIKEVGAGYMMDGEVLMPARVVVAE